MNNAGLPGTGLGGLFYILLALGMPVVEAYRTLCGQSSPGRWRAVATQFAMACGILGVMAGSALVFVRVVGAPSPFGLHGADLALAPLVLAVVLLSALVAGLRVWAALQSPPVEQQRSRPGKHKVGVGAM